MKRWHYWVLWAVSALAAGGCTSSRWSTITPQGTTTVALVGNEGAAVDGFYVQYGRRTPFRGALPFSLTRSGIAELQIWKARPDDILALAAQTDDRGWHAEVLNEAGPGSPGLRLRVDHGLAVERLAP